MFFSDADVTSPNITAASAYPEVMGYNEPGHGPPQANMNVAACVASWPSIVSTGARIGSPSGSHTEFITPGQVIYDFLHDASNPHVDFLVLHEYAAVSADHNAQATAIMAGLKSVWDLYHKPIKVGELGMTNFVGSPDTWVYPSETDYIAFLQDIIPRFRLTTWIEMVNPYPTTVSAAQIAQNPNIQNVLLCDLSGNLTNVGRAYRDLIAIRR